MTETDALLLLNAIPGIGNARAKSLIDYFGSAEKVFSLDVLKCAAIEGVPSSVIKKISAS